MRFLLWVLNCNFKFECSYIKNECTLDFTFFHAFYYFSNSIPLNITEVVFLFVFVFCLCAVMQNTTDNFVSLLYFIWLIQKGLRVWSENCWCYQTILCTVDKLLFFWFFMWTKLYLHGCYRAPNSCFLTPVPIYIKFYSRQALLCQVDCIWEVRALLNQSKRVSEDLK